MTETKDEETTPKTIPPYLFRYYSFPHDPNKLELLKKLFSENKLTFSSPAKFNDPFDCKTSVLQFPKSGRELHDLLMETARHENPNWPRKQRKAWVRSIENKKLHIGIHEEIKRKYQAEINRHGVLCLSEHDSSSLTPPASLLMWSHYADGHRGFCLQFATKNEFFSKAAPVCYQNKFPLINAADCLFPKNNQNAESGPDTIMNYPAASCEVSKI